MKSLSSNKITKIFNILDEKYSSFEWWLDCTPFEIIIGAILVQNTTWRNAETALNNIKYQDLAKPEKLINTYKGSIIELIKPSGFYNLKLKRILNFLSFFQEAYLFSFENMKKQDLPTLRKELLNVNGIGAETADVILLYALDKLTFCIDNYTKRLFSRLGYIRQNIKYGDLKNIFEDHVKNDILIYKQFHKYIDFHSHYVCRKEPDCAVCSLNNICDFNLVN
ncbi:endonuclease III domain-containing protein [candidate division KSB1 bacterium]